MNDPTATDKEKTAWRVICPHHGPRCLTHEQYVAQMNAPHARWACPGCGETSRWDDRWYEEWSAPGPEREVPSE